MKPFVAYGGYVALALSIVLLSSRSAYSGGQASGGLVRLQPTTPGLAQTGNLNISGTAVAGQIQGSGAGLTDLDAGNLATGTVPDGRLGVGGDLTGPLSAATVTKLRGRSFANVVPTAGQVLGFDGTSWKPQADGLTLPTTLIGNQVGAALTIRNNTGNVALFKAEGPTGTALVASAGNTTVFVPGSGVSVASDSDTGYGVISFAYGAAATAGCFVNRVATPDIVVNLATPTEAIRTNGFVWREYNTTAPSVAVPIAYGCVSSTGTITGGTGNFTVTKFGTGQYDILIDGETYSNSTFTVAVTAVSNSPRMTAVADPGAAFRVNIWNSTFTLTDTPFQFSVYTSNPANPG